MMISSWRKRRSAKRAAKEQQRNENGEMELTIPRDFRCPISLDLMKDPVTLSSGITYDRESIEKWIEAGNFTCPLTNQVLKSLEPIPNHVIRKQIQEFCVENRSYGIERIPTPRVPISSVEVSETLSKIELAFKNQDGEGCRALVVKLKSSAKESDRNKRCIVSNGAGSVLSEAFAAFSMASSSFDQNASVLEEILSAFVTMFPLDAEAKGFLGSVSSIHCLIWFLSSGDLSRRRNAVLALKELVSSKKVLNQLSEMEGGIEALFKLIKDPICPTSTKASLTIIYHIITSSSNEKQVAKLVKLGIVSLLIETLADTERGMCEKALGVLNGIFNTEQGREAAYNNALTMPVLVKKILRVSNLATEFSVSILWKLCKNETRENGGVLVEALQVGAFQKLLLLLQLGCVEKTKDRVTELLKMLNLHRDKVECIDSVDHFKDLKRPF